MRLKTKLLLGLALVLSGAFFGCSTVRDSSSPAPAYYLHAGVCSAFTDQGWIVPRRILCAQIQFGEPIYVVSDSSNTNMLWDFNKLAGRIDRRGTNLVVDLTFSWASQSQFYRGDVVLEKPFFAQGGAASGGAGPPVWFILSTNFDKKPVLEKIHEINVLHSKQ